MRDGYCRCQLSYIICILHSITSIACTSHMLYTVYIDILYTYIPAASAHFFFQGGSEITRFFFFFLKKPAFLICTNYGMSTDTSWTKNGMPRNHLEPTHLYMLDHAAQKQRLRATFPPSSKPACILESRVCIDQISIQASRCHLADVHPAADAADSSYRVFVHLAAMH